MEYIKLFWEGAPEGEPPVILYEVDTEHERLAFRSIDIFAGGRTHTGELDSSVTLATPLRFHSHRGGIQRPCLG